MFSFSIQTRSLRWNNLQIPNIIYCIEDKVLGYGMEMICGFSLVWKRNVRKCSGHVLKAAGIQFMWSLKLAAIMRKMFTLATWDRGVQFAVNVSFLPRQWGSDELHCKCTSSSFSETLWKLFWKLMEPFFWKLKNGRKLSVTKKTQVELWRSTCCLKLT